MYEAQLRRLKQILAVPTFFNAEHQLLRHLIKFLKTRDYTIHYRIDDAGNLYITKGVADVYPCVCAHTDSVQAHTTATALNFSTRTANSIPR